MLPVNIRSPTGDHHRTFLDSGDSFNTLMEICVYRGVNCMGARMTTEEPANIARRPLAPTWITLSMSSFIRLKLFCAFQSVRTVRVYLEVVEYTSAILASLASFRLVDECPE